MCLKKRLIQILIKEAYRPGLLGPLVNPNYIIRHRLFKGIEEMAPNIQGDILDFGCGSKPYESLFSHASCYVGCDIETSGHSHIDSKVDYFYDGKTLPFRDHEFDAVVAFEVFEHIFNLPEILREIHRITKPEGQLLISIPFAWEEHEVPYDFARYTRYGITKLLRDAGYEVVELKKTTSSFLAITQLGIAYLQSYLVSTATMVWPGILRRKK